MFLSLHRAHHFIMYVWTYLLSIFRRAWNLNFDKLQKNSILYVLSKNILVHHVILNNYFWADTTAEGSINILEKIVTIWYLFIFQTLVQRTFGQDSVLLSFVFRTDLPHSKTSYFNNSSTPPHSFARVSHEIIIIYDYITYLHALTFARNRFSNGATTTTTTVEIVPTRSFRIYSPITRDWHDAREGCTTQAALFGLDGVSVII